MPTWLCRDPGPEGEFLRKASIDQHWVTSSGYLNCVSAGGRFLGGMASPEILDAFAKLPENERLPGAVKVPGLPEAARVIPEPPEGGIVLRVHARFLHREGGTLRAAALGDFPQIAAEPDRWAHWALFLQPNTEYAWLTADECRAMIPDNPKAGDRIEGDPTIAARLARFHLTPKRATTSEAGILRPSDVRAARFTLEVTEATPECARAARRRDQDRLRFDAEKRPRRTSAADGVRGTARRDRRIRPEGGRVHPVRHHRERRSVGTLGRREQQKHGDRAPRPPALRLRPRTRPRQIACRPHPARRQRPLSGARVFCGAEVRRAR
ncbi:MAG: hypothetical protein R3F11_29990 [Verrucomicrobiales bacterium]